MANKSDNSTEEILDSATLGDFASWIGDLRQDITQISPSIKSFKVFNMELSDGLSFDTGNYNTGRNFLTGQQILPAECGKRWNEVSGSFFGLFSEEKTKKDLGPYKHQRCSDKRGDNQRKVCFKDVENSHVKSKFLDDAFQKKNVIFTNYYLVINERKSCKELQSESILHKPYLVGRMNVTQFTKLDEKNQFNFISQVIQHCKEDPVRHGNRSDRIPYIKWWSKKDRHRIRDDFDYSDDNEGVYKLVIRWMTNDFLEDGTNGPYISRIKKPELNDGCAFKPRFFHKMYANLVKEIMDDFLLRKDIYTTENQNRYSEDAQKPVNDAINYLTDRFDEMCSGKLALNCRICDCIHLKNKTIGSKVWEEVSSFEKRYKSLSGGESILGLMKDRMCLVESCRSAEDKTPDSRYDMPDVFYPLNYKTECGADHVQICMQQIQAGNEIQVDGTLSVECKNTMNLGKLSNSENDNNPNDDNPNDDKDDDTHGDNGGSRSKTNNNKNILIGVGVGVVFFVIIMIAFLSIW